MNYRITDEKLTLSNASSELTNDGQFEISPDLNKLCC